MLSSGSASGRRRGGISRGHEGQTVFSPKGWCITTTLATALAAFGLEVIWRLTFATEHLLTITANRVPFTAETFAGSMLPVTLTFSFKVSFRLG
jgi:hypothetical protein